jgi:DNA-binding transcriptional LysR family regulator
MKPSLDDVYLFAEVMSAGGLIKGAKRLGLPKSTVSRRLAKLEHDVGAKLFDRDARHFAVTEVGQAYAQHAAQLVDAYGAAQDFMAHRDAKPRGVLKIAMPADFAIFYLAQTIASFTHAFPSVTLDIEASPQLVDIVGERFDLAIRMGKLPDSSLIAKPLIHVRRHFYASKQLLKKTGVPKTLAQLQELPFVLLQTQAPGASTLRVELNGSGEVFVPRTVIKTNSIGLVRELAASGAGVAALPDAMANSQMVRVLDTHEPTAVEAHFLLPQKQWLPAKTRAFVEHVQRSIAA